MSVIRIKSADRDKLIDLADKILLAWRGYTDEEAFILSLIHISMQQFRQL